jgi:D-alanyl-D-alanine carboxypeptidase
MQSLLFAWFLSVSAFPSSVFTGDTISPPESFSLPKLSPVPEKILVKEEQKKIDAKSVLIIDKDTLFPVYEYESTKKLPIASLAKLMTALLVLENTSLFERVSLSSQAVQAEGSKAYFLKNEQFFVKDMLAFLIIRSANDSALALSEHIASSEANFVDMMNTRAKELGLKNTVFKNASGLDHEDSFSTASDVALLFLKLWEYPLFRELSSLSSYEGESLQGRKVRVRNTNQFLKEGVLGGKTGTTSLAKQCLSLAIQKGSHTFFVIILGSDERYADAEMLFHLIQGNS